MRKFVNIAEEKGTLLVEALAMLGLIAMVTPTLYKKSAERLQEIQDINAASQVRVMNSVVESFTRNNFQKLMDATSSDSNPTVELAFDDNTAGAFETGYSSFLPYGYTPNELRNYKAPKVYVHRDKHRLVTYLVFPHAMDPGKKRASRLASLVGSNGGVITDRKEAQGTGGAWYLDSSMVSDIRFDDDVLTENSLIVTSSEPIENSMEDNDKYLYRVPTDNPETDAHHNTMITDLYMGGHLNQEMAGNTQWESDAKEYHGILNVRKLTMNTNCNITGTAANCDPEVADLYIGKPWASASGKYSSITASNEGAAWIYGNLSALNEGFKIMGNASSLTEMVFKPSDGSSMADYDIIYASGSLDSSDVEVRMAGDFVHVEKNNDDYTFRIASSMVGDADDYLLTAEVQAGQHTVSIGANEGSHVYVARKGGEVYINSQSPAAGGNPLVHAKTVINSGGGGLYAGSYDGDWLAANGRGTSSRVEIMKDGGNYFVVGQGAGSSVVNNPNDTFAENSKMYVDFGSTPGNSSEVSLYGRRIKILEGQPYQPTSQTGGMYGASGINAAKEGLTAISTMYTDIFGSTYMGNNQISSSDTGGALYTRSSFVMGVAGNAWIDELLWARKAWFNDAGFRDLHAGFSGTSSYLVDNRNGWLNVYAPGGALGNGMVIIRDPSKVAGNVYASEQDMMFMASSGVVNVRDTEGAWMELNKGEARMGTKHNYFMADKSDSSNTGVISGSSYVFGGRGVHIETVSDSDSSSVSLQKGALELYAHAGQDGEHENTIVARAGELGIMLGSTAVNGVEDSRIYANKDMVRTRYVDFEIQRNGDGGQSSKIFGVYRDGTPNGSSNVDINGSLHVKGNDVIHIASDAYNTAEKDSSRAMFEVDPSYVRVWAKDRYTGNYGDGGADYYAMLSINSEDVSGSSIAGTNIMDNTSIYVRKGAIELEQSYGNNGENSTFAADEGYGYIKANRLVSNTNMVANDGPRTNAANAYDQYMVNPAYTSVMHDIKLTTRGGARLSDVLPDFVLKGVYNVSNDYLEGSKSKRIRWSAGNACGKGGVECVPQDVAWADPYIGILPYAMCPPGYKNMATMMPISFQMGRTGRMVTAGANGGAVPKGMFMLSEPLRQSDILKKAVTVGNIMYPSMQETKSLYWNEIYQSSDTFSQFVATNTWKTEGWFWGLKSEHDKFGYLSSSVQFGDPTAGTVDVYTDSNNDKYAVAEPLYFQEGTFLKTSLNPNETNGKGWAARMGFLYDAAHYNSLVTNGGDRTGIFSNNTDGEDNEGGGVTMAKSYIWNVFPVATNTLEGHATVYCYFDRNQFDGTNVLKFDTLSDSYNYKDKSSSDAYVKRLDDPSLKYSNPW
ncbi:MAG: hypothetical protein IKW39_03930 [Alphaproteobacteria bacterium]|nr:hypothetical protein [Alphaproteobacteria bacterium]